jgi:hypothetical protein
MKQMDTLLFQHGQSIDEIKNRLNCIENGVGDFSTSNDGAPVSGSDSVSVSVSIKSDLMSDPEFVNGIVDNIMTNSNLAEIIEQIDAVQSENRELRDLIYAQQKTMNEMNIMLLKLFSQSVVVAAPNPVAAPTVAVPTVAVPTVAVPTPVAAPTVATEAVEDAEEENVCQEVVEADAENVVVEADADADADAENVVDENVEDADEEVDA